jgi:hypothetical protein
MFTHPSPQLVSAKIVLSSSEVKAPWYWDMVGYLLSQLPYLDSKGVAGYNTAQPVTTTTNLSSFTSNTVILDAMDTSTMSSIWDPILDHVTKTWPQAIQTTNITAYRSFLEWYGENYDRSAVGADVWVGSRLMDAASLEDRAAIQQAFQTFAEIGGPIGSGAAHLVIGPGVRDAKPRGGGNAVCPAWRKATIHASKLTSGAVALGPDRMIFSLTRNSS